MSTRNRKILQLTDSCERNSFIFASSAFVFGIYILETMSQFSFNHESKQRQNLTNCIPLLDYNTNEVSETVKYLYNFSTAILEKKT